MMVRNEEEYIVGCLEQCQDIVDEYVVVDTGSTDKTIALIENFAKYSHVPFKFLKGPEEWVYEKGHEFEGRLKNYSIPRNFTLDQATKKWILHLDADERIAPQDFPKLVKITEGESDLAIFHVINYLEKCKSPNVQPKYASSESVRLFKKSDQLYYTGVIHETLDDALSAYRQSGKIGVTRAPFVLHHYGYLKKREVVKNKLAYYEELNKNQSKITDDKDPRPHFNLALHYLEENNDAKALECFQNALSLNPKFWHANHQMACMNIKSAKYFLAKALKSMPQEHPFLKEGKEIFKYLSSKTFEQAKVCA